MRSNNFRDSSDSSETDRAPHALPSEKMIHSSGAWAKNFWPFSFTGERKSTGLAFFVHSSGPSGLFRSQFCPFLSILTHVLQHASSIPHGERGNIEFAFKHGLPRLLRGLRWGTTSPERVVDPSLECRERNAPLLLLVHSSDWHWGPTRTVVRRSRRSFGADTWDLSQSFGASPSGRQ